MSFPGRHWFVLGLVVQELRAAHSAVAGLNPPPSATPRAHDSSRLEMASVERKDLAAHDSDIILVICLKRSCWTSATQEYPGEKQCCGV